METFRPTVIMYTYTWLYTYTCTYSYVPSKIRTTWKKIGVTEEDARSLLDIGIWDIRIFCAVSRVV